MKRTVPIFAIATAAALTLAACSASASGSGAMVNATSAGSAHGAAAASASPSAEPQWADPSAPKIFKFMATDLVTGKPVDGTTLIGKDVVLWFWASWCPVCNAEAGAMVNAMPSFPLGVTVLGVAGESSVAESKTFIADHAGIGGFPSIYDQDGHIWKDFGVVGQPTMVLIKHDGMSLTYEGGYGKFDIIDKVAWLGQA
jgi:peroxiredoxin